MEESRARDQADTAVEKFGFVMGFSRPVTCSDGSNDRKTVFRLRRLLLSE